MEKVLEKIIRPLRESGIDCFLINNASTDRTESILKSHISEEDEHIRYLRSGENLGFGRAHNLVLETISSKYHLICNPDIIFESIEPLCACLDYMESEPSVGLATIRLLNGDGSLQYANKRSPNVLDLFLRRFMSRESAPAFIKRRMDRYEMRPEGYEQVVDVPFVTGAFMMIRTELLKAIEGFDPRYFLYFEDADLSRKIRLAGHRTVYFPGATAIHLWDRAPHKNLRMGGILLKNMFRFFGKWGWAWF